MKHLFFFVVLWFWVLAGMVSAQGHDAHWIFGMGYHMEFVDGDVVMHPRLEHYVALEGASCISDKDGNLLFYSNTQRIWNRQHQPLWNGDGINTLVDTIRGSSITNGSMFLPWPGDTADRYFAFLVLGEEDRKLYFSRIDRLLDNGYGGIEPGYKNMLLSASEVGEQLTAVRHGNGRDWWVLVRKAVSFGSSNAFVSLLVTPEGVDTATVSLEGLRSSTWGELTASRDGSLLALASPEKHSWIGVFAFDRCSGSVSILDTIGKSHPKDVFYGIAFGDMSNAVYISTEKNGSLYEFKWLDSTSTLELLFTINDQLVSSPNILGQLELASINKIILPYSFINSGIGTNSIPALTKHLGSIDPSLPSAIAFDSFFIVLPDTTNLTASLPHFPNYELGALLGSPCDSLSPPVDTTTSITIPVQQGADWSVHPTLGKDRFAVSGVPQGASLVAYDAFGRKAGTWTVSSDSFTIQADTWPQGFFWLVARSRTGEWLGIKRIVVAKP